MSKWMLYLNSYIAVMLLLYTLIGCSSGGGNGVPTLPDTNPGPGQDPLSLTDGSTDQGGDRAADSTGHSLLLYVEIYFDPESSEFEIVPVREAEIHLNILKFLEQAPCNDCFSFTGFQYSDHESWLIGIQIKHPFVPLDYTIFDVRGIMMFPGSKTFPSAGLTASNFQAGDGYILNADGFTTLYNPTTIGNGPGGLHGYFKGNFATVDFPECDLNPFKRYRSDDPVNTRNALYGGGTAVTTYDVVFPTGPFFFGYAVDANWESPLVEPVENPITDFPPEANCPEPWKIEVSEEPIDGGLTISGGQTMLTIDVYDWQGFDSHKTPTVECPGIFTGTIEAALESDMADFSRWKALVENELLAESGIYQCLVSVEDNENGPPVEWLDLTAYQIIDLEVKGGGPTEPPIAMADYAIKPGTVCVDITFSTVGSHDPDGGEIEEYWWDWDNDGTYDEEGSPIIHSWDVPGEYPVMLKVIDDEGEEGFLASPLIVEVLNLPPKAMAVAPDAVDGKWWVNALLQFDGSGSFDTDCDGESITKFEWNFYGEGPYWVDVGPTPTFMYDYAGIYDVQLMVTDDEGATDLLDVPLTLEIQPQNLPPVAKAMATPNPQLVCEPVHFMDDGSYDQDYGDVVKWAWDFDGDLAADAEGPDVYYAFDEPGTHEVNMAVWDEENYVDVLDELLEIVILNGAPVPVAEADKYEVFEDEDIQFDGSESYDGDCGGQLITKFEWNFNGDGIYWADIGPTPVHSYSMYGTYHPRLRVTDDEGASVTSDPLEILVKEYLKPVAIGYADPNPQIVCETVDFDATESYAQTGDYIASYEWNFAGDGMYWADAGPTPSHTFYEIGAHYVGLRVRDNYNMVGYMIPPLQVDILNASPTAVALADKYEVMEDEPVHFDGSESHDNDCGNMEIVRYDWSFNGDGYYMVDIGPTPTHSYSVFGTYNVNLRVWDDEGGADSLDDLLQITVYPDNYSPVAIADRNPPLQIVCESVHFFDDGSYPNAGDFIDKYEWDWNNDGVFDEEGSSVYHTWYENGTYYVQFRVTDDLGYTDTLDEPLMVLITDNNPTAEAFADKYEAVPGEYIAFDGTGSHDNDCDNMEIAKFEWNFNGDGYYWQDAGPAPVHAYSTYGIYQAQLRVTDDEGSQDLLDSPLTIYVIEGDNSPPVITMVNHSRTTSEINNASEAVHMGVDFTDPLPEGDTHTFLWTCDYGYFDDPESPSPTWFPGGIVAQCDITVRVTDAGGLWDEGSCSQWVTEWGIWNNNPNAENGSQVIPYDLKDIFNEIWINPGDYPFPDVQPDGTCIFITFWATWAGPSISELDELTTIYNIYGGVGYKQLHISMENEAVVENWLNNHPGYYASHWLNDPDFAYFGLSNDWLDSSAVPQHLIFDRDGNCRAAHLGSVNNNMLVLTKYIQQLR